MAAAKKSEPARVAVAVAEPVQKLPEITTVGMHKTEKGYVVLVLRSQGNVVLDQEIVGNDGPQPKYHADNLLRMEVVRRFILGTDPMELI